MRNLDTPSFFIRLRRLVLELSKFVWIDTFAAVCGIFVSMAYWRILRSLGGTVHMSLMKRIIVDPSVLWPEYDFYSIGEIVVGFRQLPLR